MTVINTNTAAMVARNNMNKVAGDLDQAMERLSSGLRINSASDDAAGLAISNRMEAQVRGIQMQIRNASDGISLVQSVEGALQEAGNILQRMNELAVQANNATFNDTDRQALQNEVAQLQTELDRIASDTQFNKKAVLDGSYSGVLNVGMSEQGSIPLSVADHSASGLSGNGTTDAVASLMSSVSHIALGVNNQSAAVSTAQEAVVKADTQGISSATTTHNIDQDNSQKVTVTTLTTGLDASSSTVTMTLGTSATSTNLNIVENLEAGSKTGDVVFVDETAATIANDGTAQVASFKITDALQTGDRLSFTTDSGSSSSAVTYTVSYLDMGADEADTNSNVIDNFINAINTAELKDRTDQAGGLLTASRQTDSLGNEYVVISAAEASSSAITATLTVTDYTADATESAVVGTITAATGIVAAYGDVTFSGKYEEGDTITLELGDDVTGASAFEYIVQRSDLGSNDTATRENVVQSVIAAWNAAANDDSATSTAAGRVTAALGASSNSVIRFTGSETASGATFTMTKTATDRTQYAVSVTTVTAATNNAGTTDGPVTTGVGATTASRTLEVDSDQLEKGDILTLNIAGTEIEHTVTSAEAASASTLATNLTAKINAPTSTGKISTEGAGELTAAASSNVITITAEKAGAAGNFDVSVASENRAAKAQVNAVTIDGSISFEEGDVLTLALSATNKVQVEITKEIADMTTNNGRKAVVEAFIAKSDELEGVTLSAHPNDVTGYEYMFLVTADTAGEAFTIDSTLSVETGASARAEVEQYKISGEIGYGDTFTFEVGSTSVNYTVTEEVAKLGTNAERIEAVRDAVLAKALANTTIRAAANLEADGTDAIKATALTAGATGITMDSTNTATNQSAYANQAQVSEVTLSGTMEEGDEITVSLGGSNAFTYVVTADDVAGSSAADHRNAVRDSMVAAASALSGVTASAGADSTLVLTANSAGDGFEVSASTVNAANVAQVENVAFANVEAGDSFTVSIGGQSASYTAVDGDDASSVANWFANNASFDGKALAAGGDGSLSVTGAAGESFSVATSTANFEGQSQINTLSLSGTVETADVYSVEINGHKISFSVPEGVVDIEGVAEGLASAINNDAAVNGSVVAAATSDGALTLTSLEQGGNFIAVASVEDTGRSRDSIAGIDISTAEGAAAAQTVIAGALDMINATRSELGAIENRLDHTINNLSNVMVNTEASKSRIMDADFSVETAALSKAQILSQAATAMLAQANASKQSVLSLLQG